jgi:hypothetical protein
MIKSGNESMSKSINESIALFDLRAGGGYFPVSSKPFGSIVLSSRKIE